MPDISEVRDTKHWPTWADGMRVCPMCGSQVHPRYVNIHADSCVEIKAILGEPIGRTEHGALVYGERAEGGEEA